MTVAFAIDNSFILRKKMACPKDSFGADVANCAEKISDISDICGQI